MVDTAQLAGRTINMHAIIERFYPMTLGAISAVGWLIYGHKLAALCVSEGWHLDQLYIATFAFLAITTGFLATSYCAVIAIPDGFIGSIRGTSTFAGFLLFVKRAIALGFFVSLASIPFMIVQPTPIVPLSVAAIAVSAWFGTAIWTIAAFFRVAALFFFLFESKVKPRRPAG